MDLQKETKTIGEKIRAMRVRRGYSQEVMAQMLNMSPTGYARIEQDKSPELSIKRLEQIAETLESNLHEVLLQGDREYSYITGNSPTINAETISDNGVGVSFIVNNNLPHDYQSLKQENAHLREKIGFLEKENSSLQEINALLRKG